MSQEGEVNDIPLLSTSSPTQDTEGIKSEGSSDGGVFLLLINTTIGSGTLLIPYCFQCGLSLVLIVSFIMALVALWSLWMLIEAGTATRVYDYPGLFSVTFGQKYKWIMDLWIVLVLFGTIIIYVLWVGRLMKHIISISGSIFNKPSFWNFSSALFLIFPLTIFRSMKKLESWSGVALFFIIWLIIFALYWFIKGISDEGFHSEKIVYYHVGKQLISTFGIQSMAYDCHCNVFQALSLYKNPTREKSRKITSIVVVASFVMYNAFGLFVYLHLFDKLGAGAALEYYPLGNWFTKLTILGVIFILILGAPMMVFPTRNSLLGLFNIQNPSTFIWNLFGVILVFGATCIASLSNNIVFFFDLVGGLMTPGFVFTLPAIFYLKHCKEIKWTGYLISAFVIISSIAATIACTYQVLKGTS